MVCYLCRLLVQWVVIYRLLVHGFIIYGIFIHRLLFHGFIIYGLLFNRFLLIWSHQLHRNILVQFLRQPDQCLHRWFICRQHHQIFQQQHAIVRRDRLRF